VGSGYLCSAPSEDLQVRIETEVAAALNFACLPPFRLRRTWQPAIDPKPADTFACDAIEMVIVPRARDLGADWKMARFEAIPGDTEFIPLPEPQA
jgi:hypothetical protein